MLAKNKRLTYILSAVLLLLSLPLIAMQFTNEVNWTASDFIIAGILLGGTGLIIEAILRSVRLPNRRLALVLLVLLVLATIWAELAVGVFGTPFAGS